MKNNDIQYELEEDSLTFDDVIEVLEEELSKIRDNNDPYTPLDFDDSSGGFDYFDYDDE